MQNIIDQKSLENISGIKKVNFILLDLIVFNIDLSYLSKETRDGKLSAEKRKTKLWGRFLQGVYKM